MSEELDDFYDEEEENMEDTYLTFSVGEEEYAVCVINVTEIVRVQKIISVPDVPDFIKGVINLRGKVIPVMDVRTRFGFHLQDYSDRTVIIVLENEGTLTGLVVDGVNEVAEISPQKIDPPPQWNQSQNAIVRGLGRRDKSVSIILDVDKLLQNAEVHLNVPQNLETEEVGAK